MVGRDGNLLAVEAKSLQSDLTDKHAAQLVQYCAVEGIEWAALTNGRELQFFNTFLKTDLSSKRILDIDMLGFRTEEDFDELFEQLWRLSRSHLSTPQGAQSWLNQRRLDLRLRQSLLDPGSAAIRQVQEILESEEVSVSNQELSQWFRSHLTPAKSRRPVQPHEALPQAQPHAESLDAHGFAQLDVSSLGGKRNYLIAETTGRRRAYHGVSLRNLLDAGLLPAGTPLILLRKSGHEVARASISVGGEIMYGGKLYPSPSDKDFIRLLGLKSFNGWEYWHAEFPGGRIPIAAIRARFLAGKIET
jgi:hypothetical protein